ncbi:hypothetical protein Agub_g3917, partial [Astrephomene gubernaculifera]
MSNTMGESTRARLAGVIRSVNAGGAGGGGDRAPGNYVGGYAGGLGGTWGKAPTNRGVDPRAADGGGGGGGPARPASAGRQRPASATGGGGGGGVAPFGSPGGPAAPYSSLLGSPGAGALAGGVRERIRPASSGAKNAWDELPRRELPRSPPFGTTTKQIKPASATLAGGRTTKPLAGIALDLKSPGLGHIEATA